MIVKMFVVFILFFLSFYNNADDDVLIDPVMPYERLTCRQSVMLSSWLLFQELRDSGFSSPLVFLSSINSRGKAFFFIQTIRKRF